MPDKKLTPDEFVLQKYPNAFVDDDGDSIKIRITKSLTEPCAHCGQSWTHQVIDYGQTLGSGGTYYSAWRNAAINLGYV